ncbi:MAG: hypothetical protein ABI426_08600 [Flavobacterium sp.]
MKPFITCLLVLVGMTSALSQEKDNSDSTGENFSLEGALAMFKNANTLEDFEKLLNEENNNVNNLDLNDDGDIDYVSVEDIMNGDNHVIVLSAVLGDNEKQDIATIDIEKTGKEQAELQITGDNDLYAANTIAEPSDVSEKLDSSGKGPAVPVIITKGMVVNVWFWPSIRFIYAPGYHVWVSPNRWGYYPRWWKPWRPYRHTVFISRCAPHRVYFHRTPVRRVIVAHRTYGSRRHSSTLVVKSRKGTKVIRQEKPRRVKAVHMSRRR